jgi:hypothetical protein
VVTERSIRVIQMTSPRHRNSRLLLDLVGDREGDLVLLEAGVENLVVEKRGCLRFEEDAGSLFVDHLVILSG